MSQGYSFFTLYVEQLHDLYSAEEQIMEMLPEIVDVISDLELRKEIRHYESEVKKHLDNLVTIFTTKNLEHTTQKCKSIEGTLEECAKVIGHGGNSAVKDASLIIMLQRLQHEKMALYGACRTLARHINDNQSMNLLQHALNEEVEADKKLTHLAEGGLFTTGINEEAYKATLEG